MVGFVMIINIIHFHVRMEVWSGQVDQEHAEDVCGSDSTQPLHHVDGSHQEEISRAEGGQIPSKDEVQENHER